MKIHKKNQILSRCILPVRIQHDIPINGWLVLPAMGAPYPSSQQRDGVDMCECARMKFQWGEEAAHLIRSGGEPRALPTALRYQLAFLTFFFIFAFSRTYLYMARKYSDSKRDLDLHALFEIHFGVIILVGKTPGRGILPIYFEVRLWTDWHTNVRMNPSKIQYLRVLLTYLKVRQRVKKNNYWKSWQFFLNLNINF